MIMTMPAASMLLLLQLLCANPAALSFESSSFQLPVDEPLAGGSACSKSGLDLLAWHDGAALLHGRAFNDTASTYERLPARAKAGEGPGGKGPVRRSIWELQTQPAGQFLQFTTDASCIFVRYAIASDAISMWHFPSTGVAGVDLYGWDEGNATWRWTGTSHPEYPETQGKLASISCPAGQTCPPRAYRLHLPTYMATLNVSIGIDRTANIIAPDASHLGRHKPIVWYGTSILQGGVASRPGQVNTHIVSRALETEIYNFGFSGNGIMELSVAQYLAEIDASMIIVDCNWNMDAAMITQNAVPLVKYFRANGHATTPIVLAEGTPSGTDWAAPDAGATQQGANALALAAAYKALIAGGDKYLYYAKSADLFADTLGMPAVNTQQDDPTVGGCHLSDLGMRKQAAYWAAAIPKFLSQSRSALQPAAAAAAAVSTTARRQIAATPLTPAETRDEHARSEAAIARVVASAGPDGWGEIGAVPSSPRAVAPSSLSSSSSSTTTTTTTTTAPMNASRFARGRLFPEGLRNNTFDRFPLSYAPVCPCHGGQPCGCGLRNDVWSLSEMSTGTYLRFTTDAHEIAVDWTMRKACDEHWFAGCHLWHMPDSGTNAHDTYAFDERTKTWRHLANSLLHYAIPT